MDQAPSPPPSSVWFFVIVHRPMLPRDDSGDVQPEFRDSRSIVMERARRPYPLEPPVHVRVRSCACDWHGPAGDADSYLGCGAWLGDPP